MGKAQDKLLNEHLTKAAILALPSGSKIPTEKDVFAVVLTVLRNGKKVARKGMTWCGSPNKGSAEGL